MLTDVEKAFLAVLREDGSGDDVHRYTQRFNSSDWQALSRLAFKSGLFPIFYARLSESRIENIPSEISLRFKALHFSNLTRNIILEKELISILSYLKGKSIPVIPLKGPVLARLLYEDLRLRQFSSDLDILVPRPRVKEALNKLKALDYFSGFDDEGEDFFYRHRNQIALNRRRAKRNTAIDLHWDFRDGFTNTHVDSFWRNARYVRLDGYEALFPACEDLMLFLVLTTMSDFEFVQIRHIYDIHRFIQTFKSQTDWDMVVRRASDINLSSATFFYLALSESFFSTDVPKKVLDSMRPSFLKRNVLGAWINECNVLRSAETIASMRIWRYFFGSYLLSNGILDCAKIVSRRILSRVSYRLCKRHIRI